MEAVLADIIAFFHAAFIGFVVFGLLLILLGAILRWKWVRNIWFRAAHLLAILYVVFEAWCGIACPLTIWEARLRRAAGQESFDTGFIAYWLHRLIFFQAEPWVFTLAYTLFGAAVLGTFFFCPPRFRKLQVNASI